MNSINEKPAIFLFKEDYKELIRKLAEEINPYERIESLFKYHKEYNSGFLENLLTYSRQESWLQCIKLSYQELITVQENKILDDIITRANVDIFDEETLKNIKLSIEQIEVKILIRAEGKFITNSIFPLRYPKLYLDVLSCFVWHRDNVDEYPGAKKHGSEPCIKLSDITQSSNQRHLKAEGFTCLSICMAFQYLKKKGISPVKQIKDKPMIFYKALAQYADFSVESIRQDYPTVDTKLKRSKFRDQITLAIKYLKTLKEINNLDVQEAIDRAFEEQNAAAINWLKQ